MNKNNRIIFLDYLRILATIAIIMIHVSAQNIYTTNIHTYTWHIFNIYDSAVRWGVPIFLMISGALFLNDNKKIKISILYKKNIFRIISSFLFWSTLYAILKDSANIGDFFELIILGEYHLWFLIMIIGIYMSIPILKIISKHNNIVKYYLILYLVFVFLIPQVLQIPGIPKISAIFKTYEKLNFHLVSRYSFYFLLGHYIYNKKFSIFEKKTIYCLGILGFFFTVILTFYYSKYLGKFSDKFYSNFSLNVFFESTAVFIFAKYKLSKIKFKNTNLIAKLSKYSFGIYLSHVLIINILNDYFGLNTQSFKAIFSVPLITCIVFLISLLISFVLNKIPILKKYVV